MKSTHLAIAAIIVLNGCNYYSASRDVKDSLPGVYTRKGADEFSEADDTLAISVYNVDAGTYLITRSTGFNRIIDGKKLAREYKKSEMIAVFNEKTMQLEESKDGRLFSFNKGRKELLFGTTRYVKIK